MHGTGPTLGNAAAKFGAGEVELFADGPQQGSVRRGVDGHLLVVDGQLGHSNLQGAVKTGKDDALEVCGRLQGFSLLYELALCPNARPVML